MKKIIPILIIFSFNTVASEDCLNTVKNNNLDQVFYTCVWPLSGSVEEALVKGPKHYQHGFGTRTSPSKAAKLILKKAEAGHTDYQFLWGLISTAVYPMPNYQDLKSQQDAIAQDKEWIVKAADQGHIGAMLHLINRYTESRFITPSHEEKQRLLEYVEQLIEINWPKARLLKVRLNHKKSDEEIKEGLFEQISNYETLKEEEILSLAKAMELGSIKDGQSWIRFPADLGKAAEMYRFATDKYSSPAAAFALGKLIHKSDKEEALRLMNMSAELDYPKAVGWLGDYWGCNGEKLKALHLLQQAKQLGYSEADDSIGEIEELGKPMTCDGDWVAR